MKKYYSYVKLDFGEEQKIMPVKEFSDLIIQNTVQRKPVVTINGVIHYKSHNWIITKLSNPKTANKILKKGITKIHNKDLYRIIGEVFFGCFQVYFYEKKEDIDRLIPKLHNHYSTMIFENFRREKMLGKIYS